MYTSDYTELPLYLEHDDEMDNVTLIVTLRDNKIIVLNEVQSDPIHYEGWWTIGYSYLGRRASAHIRGSDVLYFTTLHKEYND